MTNFWHNRCLICGTQLPCTVEKYLEGRNPQFNGSSAEIYERLHHPQYDRTLGAVITNPPHGRGGQGAKE